MRKFIIFNGETICKSRDDESRPRKRQRTESDDELDNHASCLAKGPLVRDQEYYKEEADCVIQVENSLFKASSSAYTHSDCRLKIYWPGSCFAALALPLG
jgi:hypothetical protein